MELLTIVSQNLGLISFCIALIAGAIYLKQEQGRAIRDIESLTKKAEEDHKSMEEIKETVAKISVTVDYISKDINLMKEVYVSLQKGNKS